MRPNNGKKLQDRSNNCLKRVKPFEHRDEGTQRRDKEQAWTHAFDSLERRQQSPRCCFPTWKRPCGKAPPVAYLRRPCRSAGPKCFSASPPSLCSQPSIPVSDTEPRNFKPKATKQRKRCSPHSISGMQSCEQHMMTDPLQYWDSHFLAVHSLRPSCYSSLSGAPRRSARYSKLTDPRPPNPVEGPQLPGHIL